MTAPRFHWDSSKARRNLAKHGVSFEEAVSVFSDEFGLYIADPEHSRADELRFVLLGLSRNVRLLLVVHCVRESEDDVRIVMARKPTRKEAAQYHERR